MKRFFLGSITRKFEIIFILILILSTVSFNAVFYLQNQQKEDAAVVDAAGRNRMLSQRIGFYAEQIVRGNEAVKGILSSIIRLHDTSFYALKNGGVAPEIANNRFLPAAPESMAYLVADAEQLWLEYRKNAEVIVNEQTMVNGALNPKVASALSFIEQNAPEMLRRNNAMVDMYVTLNYAKQMKFSLILLALLVINVATILFALHMARATARPIHTLQDATEQVEKGNFQVRVDINTGDEIEKLGDTFNKTTEALERMDEEYKEIDRAKTKFLSITSHELRSPMTAMKAEMQMLLKGYFGRLNKKQKEAVDIVLRNTTRLDDIIVDFLDISRIEAARLKFEFKKTHLEPHVKRLVKEMKGFMPEKKIKVVLNMDKLPEIEVDPNRAMQVLRNLLNNAVKFSPEKSKVVVSVAQNHEGILFSVADAGIGINEEDQKKLFEPFFQAENSMYRNYRGTGLGLAICRGIVQSQKGKIWVESALGKGSTFYFTVPFKPVKKVQPIKVIFSGKEEEVALGK
ncbi:ATP-binding protein [Nanoarchaeota archaeon]